MAVLCLMGTAVVNMGEQLQSICGLESPESRTKLPLGSESFGLLFGDLGNAKDLELLIWHSCCSGRDITKPSP